jgi:hypothetical protein
MRQKVIRNLESPPARLPQMTLGSAPASDTDPLLPPWFLEQLGWPPDAVAAHLKIHAIPGRRSARRPKSSRSTS